MDSRLKITSYNCQSIGSKIPLIESLLVNCDILLLQETLLSEYNFEQFEHIDDNFASAFTPAERREQIFVGRSSGGLAIYWRKLSGLSCNPIFFSNRIMGLKLSAGEYTCLLLNVYCICDYRTQESLLSYKDTLAQISNICSENLYDDICIIGDFNCDPIKGRFFQEFSAFASDHSFAMVDINSLPPDSYTYISSNAAVSTSWLDHILASHDDLVSDVSVRYGHSTYDHLPICCELKLLGNPQLKPDESILRSMSAGCGISWGKASDDELESYKMNLESMAINLWCSALSCDNGVSCQDEGHLNEISKVYDSLVEAVKISSLNLPQAQEHKNRIIPGWNDYCKELYSVARSKFFEWDNAGRLRNGALFDEMKAARTSFRDALKFCRSNEKNIRRDKLLAKFASGNKMDFWKEIRNVNGSSNSIRQCIGGVSAPSEIFSTF